MLTYTIRIPNNFIRVPLLVLLFPWVYLLYIMKASLPVSFGGHPCGNRLLEMDFYLMPLGLFWSAVKGDYCEGSRNC